MVNGQLLGDTPDRHGGSRSGSSCRLHKSTEGKGAVKCEFVPGQREWLKWGQGRPGPCLQTLQTDLLQRLQWTEAVSVLV